MGLESNRPVFVAVLPYSGYSFAIALSDSRQPNVVKALNCCLTYFGGVPQNIKCDNMKTAVSKSSHYEPVFTEVLTQWALHNAIMPKYPCRFAKLLQCVPYTFE
jgi:transposase